MQLSGTMFWIHVTCLVISFNVMEFLSTISGTKFTFDGHNVTLTNSRIESGQLVNYSNVSSISSIHHQTETEEFENSEHDLYNTREIINNYQYFDAFSCPPCICYRRKDDSVDADCSNRRLQKMPTKLPIYIKTLNLSVNTILELNTAHLSIYSQVSSLVISSNPRFKKIFFEPQENNSFAMITLDLSHNNISTIQNRSFLSFVNLQKLVLSENRLSYISSAMLEGLENLKSLYLSRNKIRVLNANTFANLINLELLDLSKNQLNYNVRSIPTLVFEKLTHLQQLYLQGNVNFPQPYPSRALSKLSQLTSLYIDVNLNSSLDQEWKKIKKLTTLFFGGHIGICNLRKIHRDFLANSPYLKTLILYGCNFHELDPAVFLGVKHLETLEINKIFLNYDLYQALNDLRGLVNSSLRNLTLISLSRGRYLCRSLSGKHAAYLQHLSLEELNLSENSIALIEEDFAILLPKTLKRFVLMDNKLSIKVFSLSSLSHLSELIEIYLDHQGDSLQRYHLTETNRGGLKNKNRKYISFLEESNLKRNKSVTQNAGQESFISRSHTLKMRDSESCLCADSEQSKFDSQGDFQIGAWPLNLRLVQGSHFYEFTALWWKSKWRFNSSLISISHTKNFLVKWGESNLPTKIQRVDFSHNYAMKLSEHFFPQNSSLISLNISNNILGEYFAALGRKKIFLGLGYLRFLDISMNLIYKLPRDFLSGLKSLEVLLATKNRLQALNVSLSQMSSVWFMNFSQNSITWIDKVTRDDLDLLAISRQVSLDISFNPLPCTCDGIEILNWLAFTNVRLVNQMYMKCQTSTGETVSLGDLMERAQQVQRACASKAIILVISISSAVVVTLMVSLATLYRFRWKLRYLRNIALTKYAGFRPKKGTGKKFQHDAYILYEDQTINFVFRDFIQELEVKRGHRLLLVDRDIIPGTIMTTAILSAVQNSYKTIPVVTPYFFNVWYSEYAVQMAIMEEHYEPRQILHLCVYQATDPKDMPKDLLSVMKRNRYTEFPPETDLNEEMVKQFWDHLSSTIQQRE
ncbi:toll-like receptor 4 [Biomphalaria glabrata]|uniref:Toll-like receptor 4 n=1 Tax=Biomphalaria glabrata TaxID=6526 RepID=A0A9U8EEU6_BIOGL|nr:toll-like receptor 4 [Biomphalaria glabrata]